jgi:hypothetical protein
MDVVSSFEIIISPGGIIAFDNLFGEYLLVLLQKGDSLFGEPTLFFTTIIPVTGASGQPIMACVDREKKTFLFTDDIEERARFMNEHAPSLADIVAFKALKSPR